MEYAKKFKSESDYNSYINGSDVILPNVSYVEEIEDVKFNDKKEVINYITMTSSAIQTVTKPENSNMEYSYDKKTWIAMNSAVEFGTYDKKTVYLRGKNPSGFDSNPFTLGNETALVDLGGNCQSLLDWETLPDTVPDNGLCAIFMGCKALKSIGEGFLPAMILGVNCYQEMFGECTSLDTIPSNLLPAITVNNYSYSSMFSKCSSLQKAPNLPATKLAVNCYGYMFYNCTGLTSVSLPATAVEPRCYYNMFKRCVSLKEIHCDADAIMYDCTNGWVDGVASVGDFYGKSAAGWTDGISGIPNGWTKHLS